MAVKAGKSRFSPPADAAGRRHPRLTMSRSSCKAAKFAAEAAQGDAQAG